MRQTMKMLETSIFEVFEKMFFLYLEPVKPTGADPCLKASISFTGAGEGTVDLYLSSDLAIRMAQNMLSIEADEVDDNQREDCAREAVNMICGHFLAMTDRNGHYDLTIPRCGPVDGPAPDSTGRLDYGVGDEKWAMTMILSESATHSESGVNEPGPAPGKGRAW